MSKPLRIGLFVFDEVDEMDVVGPWEVLGWWHNLAKQDVEVLTFSLPLPAGRDHVNAAKGLKLIPDAIWPDVPPLGALFYLGGQDMQAHFVDRTYARGQVRPDITAMLDAVFEGGALPVSVCVGALVYAACGIFDGKAATTHWGLLDQLAALGKDMEVRGDDRFVDNGDCLSSAGISAGIDMSLHVVRRFAGADMARQVKRMMQYYPAPPVDAIISPPWGEDSVPCTGQVKPESRGFGSLRSQE